MDLSEFGVDLLDPNIDIEDFFDWWFKNNKWSMSFTTFNELSEVLNKSKPNWRKSQKENNRKIFQLKIQSDQWLSVSLFQYAKICQS